MAFNLIPAAPPVPIDPSRAVQTFGALYNDAQALIRGHWAKTTEDSPDQGQRDLDTLKTWVYLLDMTGVDIQSLLSEWQEHWGAYQQDGGIREFTSIKPAWRDL
ncbi:hypothetical protein [Microbispora sp. KK1-11]|uniref:hypothetical protein n=1 Tax=Microbispora sp. KK1-11 TaxID=2053005 RepID=UPI0011593905|nr:hypothetical protein [Microbispora sp. KK1-11]TQS30039.1 hypothetical protein FLW16_06675 [Microbispora sp. KK1-11]